MNVALLIDTLVGGGAESVVRQLAAGLARGGHNPHVYCLKTFCGTAAGARTAGARIDSGTTARKRGQDPLCCSKREAGRRDSIKGPDPFSLAAAGVTVREARSFGRDPLLAWRLLRWMRQDAIDVANAHSSAALVWALPAAKTLGIPLIQTRHGIHLGKRAFYPRWADRLVGLVDVVTIVAESSRSDIPNTRAARAAVCLPNGVDCTRTSPQKAREELKRLCGGDLTGPVVLSVGTVCPEKDTLTLVRAFAVLRQDMVHAQLVCVGSARGSGYLERVQSTVRLLGLEGRVHLLGPVPDAHRLMAGADVFCQSSRTEAMPIAVIEAMSQGVPIVATTVGDIGSLNSDGGGKPMLLRHNQTGLLVPPGDPNALAAALWCALSDRHASRERAARAAADYARFHTGERMAQGYERVYADCLRRRGKAPRGTRKRSDRPRRPGVVMLGPAPPLIGGMVTSIGLLMKSPLRERYELYRVGSPVGPTRGAEDGACRRIRRATALLGSTRRHVAAVLKLAWLLIDKRIALLHIHTCSYFTFYRNLADLAVAKLLGRAAILHVRGGMFARFCANSGRLGRWVIRRGLEAADAVIVLSEGWRDALRPHAGNARLIVVPNAFDPDVIPTREQAAAARAARKEADPNGPCRFLFLALVRETKGVGDLIEAARMLRVLGTPFELYIAGPAADGDGARWERQVRDAGLEDVVTFTGPVSGLAKAHQLACADCFVHASHREGLPNSVLEGGAAGLPVIATTVGAIPEVFSSPDLMATGETELPLGPLVPPHDPAALAREMERLARDESLRRRIGARLRERFTAEYNIGRLAERIGAVYERVLGGQELRVADEHRRESGAVDVAPAGPGRAGASKMRQKPLRPAVTTHVHDKG